VRAVERITPALFERLRKQYDVVPLVEELSADTLTPVAAFEAISGLSAEAFLLESVERGETLGRYSFIGFSPRKGITFDGAIPDPVARLREELDPLRVYGEAELPPFFGGAVGYFGYGVARWTERLPDENRDDLDIADARVLFFDNVVVFDHVKQTLFVVANLLAWDERPSDEIVAEGEATVRRAIEALESATIDLLPSIDAPRESEFIPNCTRDEFITAVTRGKEEIAAGEIFQIVLSQRWETDFRTAEALTLYRALRNINPSPYMFLLRTEEGTLVGSSPEMLVRVHAGAAETRPIAGTRPRGATPQADAELAAELLADPKENAEHLMLVDLGRNDLGRVCRGGSVEVTEFRKVERYSHVMHLVSNVRGRLRDDRNPIDAFLSAFPAGTVSGAPKIRAMELIDTLETTRRGPYAGAVAYIGFSGNLDSCIAIRTIALARDRAWIQAGAGIVFDSVPEREYEECVNKSAAPKRAVDVAKEIVRWKDDGRGSSVSAAILRD